MAERFTNCQSTGNPKRNHLSGGRRRCEKEANILGEKCFMDGGGERTDWIEGTKKLKWCRTTGLFLPGQTGLSVSYRCRCQINESKPFYSIPVVFSFI